MAGKQVKIVDQKFVYFFNASPHRYAIRATNPEYPLEKIKCERGYCLRLQIPGLADDEDLLLENLEPRECVRVRTVSLCWGKTKRLEICTSKVKSFFSADITRSYLLRRLR